MAANHGAQKRHREESPDFDSPEERTKKLRYEYDELLLDDLVEGSGPDPIASDLDSVMKSLEDEISVSVVNGSGSGSGLVSQPEFGYLLEASDDELGLPPSTAVGEFFGLGENWGFEEDTEFRFVDGGDVGGDGEYLPLDGLFEYTDAGFGSTEYSWRSESMSAQ